MEAGILRADYNRVGIQPTSKHERTLCRRMRTTKFISRGRIFITTSAWDRGTQVVSGIWPDVTTLT